MNIDSIKNGYVIDHITAGRAMEIYKLLRLDEVNCQVALITNAKSQKSGVKDIIKINDTVPIDLDALGFIDHRVTVNVVKDDQIIEKKRLDLPNRIVNLAKCNNPRCITSIEKGLDHIFLLTDKENEIYRCQYCEMSLKNR